MQQLKAWFLILTLVLLTSVIFFKILLSPVDLASETKPAAPPEHSPVLRQEESTDIGKSIPTNSNLPSPSNEVPEFSGADEPLTEQQEELADEADQASGNTLASGNVIADVVLITDPNGNPFANAKVESRQLWEQTVLLTAFSNEKGLASAALHSKDLMILAMADGYAPAGLGHVGREKLDPNKPITLQMTLGSGITGIVVDDSGEGVPGALVEAIIEIPSGGCSHDATGLFKTNSDALGRFSFEHLPPTQVKLTASKASMVCLENSEVTTPHSKEVRLKLSNAQQIKLMVVDQRAKAISDANITLRHGLFKEDAQDRTLKEYKSNAEGFSLIDIPLKGWISVLVEAKAYLPAKLNGVSCENPADQKIVLKDALILSGNVIAADTGEGIAGARVRFKFATDGSGRDYQYTTSKKDGSFSVEKLPLGKVEASVEALGFLELKKISIDLSKENERQPVFKMQRGLIQPIVLINQTSQLPLANLETKVSARPLGSRNQSFDTIWEGKSDGAGRILVSALNSRRDILQIAAKGFAPKTLNADETGNELKCYLQAEAVLILRLKDVQEPPSRIDIRRSPDASSAVNRWNSSRKDKSNDYFIESLSEGQLQFIVDATGFRKSLPQTVQLISGQNVIHSISLQKAEELWLQLIQPDGKILEDKVEVKLNKGTRSRGSSAHRLHEKLWYRFNNDIEDYEDVTVTTNLYKSIDLKMFRSGPTLIQSTNGIYQHILQLERGREIYGKIINIQGEPIEKANIVLREVNSGRRHTNNYRSTDSQKDGGFVFGGMESNSAQWTLRASHSHYLDSNLDLPLDEMLEKELKITLLEGTQVQGGLRDTDGTPVPGHELKLQLTKPQKDFWYSQTQTSNQEGVASFNKIKAGEYRLSLADQSEGYAEPALITLDENSPDKIVWLERKKGLSLRGSVVDQQGHSVPGQSLSLTLRIPSPAEQGRTSESDGNGNFRFENLRQAEYVLKLSNNRSFYAMVGSPVIIIQPGQENIQVLVSPIPIIKGTVLTAAGQMLKDYELYQRFPPSQYEAKFQGYEFSAAGEFSFPLSITNYRSSSSFELLARTSDGQSNPFLLDTRSPPQEMVTLRIKDGGKFEVQVMGEDGSPIANSWVSKYSPTDSLQERMTGTQRVQTNAEGIARFFDESGGTWIIRVERNQNYAPQAILMNAANTNLTMTLNKGSTLHGILQGDKGLTVEKMRIIMTILDKDNLLYPYTFSGICDAQGHFSISNCIAGEYGIRCGQQFSSIQTGSNPEDFKWNVKMPAQGEVEISLALEANPDLGGIKGTIVDIPEGERFWGVYLFPAEEISFQRPLMITRLDDEQHFEFQNVPEGSYILRATGQSTSLRLEAVVEKGQITQVEFRPAKGGLSGQVITSSGDPVLSGTVMLFPQGALRDPQASLNYSGALAYTSIKIGLFKLLGVPEGDYDLLVGEFYQGSFPPYLVYNIHATGSEQDLGTISLPEDRLLHLMVSDAQGHPIAGARMGIILDSGYNLPSLSRNTVSSSSGALVAKIPVSTQLLYLSAPGYATLSSTIIADGSYILSRGANLRLETENSELKDWTISVYQSDRKPLLEARSLSGFQASTHKITGGNTLLEHLPPGQILLRLSKDSQEKWLDPITLEDGKETLLKL